MDLVKTEKAKGSADPSAKSKKQDAETTAERRLYRSRKNRVFKGVAGGIGEYFGIDPVLVRLAFLLTFAMGGVGVFAYILGWVLLPKRPKGQAVPVTPRTNGLEVLHNRSLGVWILIAIGAAFFLDQFNLNLAGDRLWPLLLIGGGLIVLMRRREAGATLAEPSIPSGLGGGTSSAAGRTAARSSTADSTMTIFDGGPSRRDLQAEALAELHDPVVDEVDRAVAELRAERMGGFADGPTRPSVSQRRSGRTPRRERSLFAKLMIGLLAFATFLTIIAGAIGIRLVSRGVGERSVAVGGFEQFTETFGAGELTVNLADLEGGSEGKISMDFGELTVRLPRGANRPNVLVTTHGRIVAAKTDPDGSGEATLFGSRTESFAGCPDAGTVELDVTITAGEVQLIPDTTTLCSSATTRPEVSRATTRPETPSVPTSPPAPSLR